MKHRAVIELHRWLLASAFTMGMSAVVLGHTLAFAQVIPGEPDHLKCYEVIQDQNLPGANEVDLLNKFGMEPNCHVANRARRFCTPVRKFIAGGNGNDPRGAALNTDFTCYQIMCPANPIREVAIEDQFGDRHIRIQDAQMLCTPTLSKLLVD